MYETSVFPAVLCRLESAPHRKEQHECKTVALMNIPFHTQMIKVELFKGILLFLGRSQWPHALRRGSAAASWLGLRVRS